MDFDKFSRFRQTGAPWVPYPNLGPEDPPPPNSWEAAYTVTQQIAWLKATIDGMESGEVTQDDLDKLKQYIDGIQRTLTAKIATKQNTLTFDSTPTAGSLNPVTSEGIKAAIDAIEPAPVDAYTKTETNALLATKQPKGDYATTEQLATVNSTLTQHTQEIADNAAVIAALDADKQDELTFDTEPTEGSLNPVTSDGIKKAIAAGGGGALDATPTADSTAGVQSGGVYAWSNPTPWTARDEIARTRPPTTKGLLDLLGLSRHVTQSFRITEAIAVNGDESVTGRTSLTFAGLAPEKLPQPEVSSAFMVCNNSAESKIKNVDVTLTQADTLEIRVIPSRRPLNLLQGCPITRALIIFQKYSNNSVVETYADVYRPTPFYDVTTDVNGLKFSVNFAPDVAFDRIHIVSIKYSFELSAP